MPLPLLVASRRFLLFMSFICLHVYLLVSFIAAVFLVGISKFLLLNFCQ